MGSRARPLSLLLLLLPLLSSLAGCATSALPPKLTAVQAEQVRTTHFAARVAVEEYEPAGYSERLVEALRSTGLFDEVGPLGAVEDPDLIASVDRPIYGTASTLPVLTVVTLGIVPTFVSEEWGEDFTLRATGDGGARVGVEFSYEGPTTLGWLALLRAPSPRHALGRPRGTPRFRAGLSNAIVEQEGEIRELLKRSSEGPAPGTADR